MVNRFKWSAVFPGHFDDARALGKVYSVGVHAYRVQMKPVRLSNHYGCHLAGGISEDYKKSRV